MSAANPKTQEPSVEEILASIRRIIADDQEAPKAPAPKPAPVPPSAVAAPAPAPEPAPVEEDVLELAEVAQPVKLSRPPLAEEPPEIDFREIEEDAGVEEAAVEEFAPRPPEP